LREPGLAPGAWEITKTVYPLSVKAVDTPTHRLRMTSQLGNYFSRAKSAPAEYDHSSAPYPVCRSVTAIGEFTYFLLLKRIQRITGVE
jgi:hypothetical protein